ncbi:MAG TPA: hypothetical protein VN222_16720, partial [Novosphingobium sp.]|nr:hypothetical protein [Novosphingobium sp.]
KTGRIERSGPFLAIPDAPVTVRDRSAAMSTTLRRADRLPPAELAVAVQDVVRNNLGATGEEIVQAVSRAFGNKATSGVVRERIEEAIAHLADSGKLVEQAGLYVVA